MKHLSDESRLVCLLKANDKAAFEYLYDKYSGALYNVVKKIVYDPATASDVLQDTFVKIWKCIQAYDPQRGSLFTWMLNIARHRAIDICRAKARLGSYVPLDVLEGDQALYSYATLPLFDFHDLRQLVDRLHPDKRDLIDLVYLQGFTQHEVSQMLAVPLGTVKSRIKKALHQLRASFGVPKASLSYA